MSEVVVICHRCRAEDRPDHTRTYKTFAKNAYCVCGTALHVTTLDENELFTCIHCKSLIYGLDNDGSTSWVDWNDCGCKNKVV